jgi:hypothetical protein
MMAVDSSILDPLRITPTADPKASLQAAVNWHFSAETGSPHCKHDSRCETPYSTSKS